MWACWAWYWWRRRHRVHALDVSPFTYVPRLPGGQVSAVPLLWLCLAALAFSAAGLAALRRRDIA